MEIYIEKRAEELVSKLKNIKEAMLHGHEKLLKLAAGESNDKRGRSIEEQKEELKEELKYERDRIISIAVEIKLLLAEMELERLAIKTGRIITALEGFDVLSKDYSKFASTMDAYISDLEKRHEIDVQLVGRLWNNIKLGYFPTDLTHVEMIKKAITFPQTGLQVNILDPCCGCGLAVEKMAEGENALSYGVEIDEARAEEARGRLHRIAKGSFFGSRISHEAFHLMFLNPPYLTVKTSSGSNMRDEKVFLIDSICHLMIGGVLVYVIPYYRLTPDIARILSDNFEDLSVYKFKEDEFRKYKQIAVMGYRVKKRNGSAMVSDLVNKALYPERIPVITGISKEYRIPFREKTVDVFKGSVFDEFELMQQMKQSNLMSKLFKQNELDSTSKRPLLPFTIGQIGLIGGSGLINGKVECQYPHILKGQVVKERRKTDSKENRKGKEVEVTETIVNKMNFKILTLDGIKVLA